MSDVMTSLGEVSEIWRPSTTELLIPRFSMISRKTVRVDCGENSSDLQSFRRRTNDESALKVLFGCYRACVCSSRVRSVLLWHDGRLSYVDRSTVLLLPLYTSIPRSHHTWVTGWTPVVLAGQSVRIRLCLFDCTRSIVRHFSSPCLWIGQVCCTFFMPTSDLHTWPSTPVIHHPGIRARIWT